MTEARKESRDAYGRVVYQEGRYRVALCRDGMQWLLQRRRKHETAPWSSLRFCVTREALCRDWREVTQADVARKERTTPAILADLPDRAGLSLQERQSAVGESAVGPLRGSTPPTAPNAAPASS